MPYINPNLFSLKNLMTDKNTPATFSFDNKTYNFNIKGTTDAWKAFDNSTTTSASLWQYEGGGGGGGYWQIITDKPVMIYQISLNFNFSNSWGYSFTLYYYDGNNWISLGNKTLTTPVSSFFIGKKSFGIKCQYSSSAPAGFSLYNIKLLLLPSQYTPTNHTGTYIDDYNIPLIKKRNTSGSNLDDNLLGNNNFNNKLGNALIDQIYGTKNTKNLIGLSLSQPITGYRNNKNNLGKILLEPIIGHKNKASFSGYNLDAIVIGKRNSSSYGYILDDDITPEHIIKNYGYAFIL